MICDSLFVSSKQIDNIRAISIEMQMFFYNLQKKIMKLETSNFEYNAIYFEQMSGIYILKLQYANFTDF